MWRAEIPAASAPFGPPVNSRGTRITQESDTADAITARLKRDGPELVRPYAYAPTTFVTPRKWWNGTVETKSEGSARGAAARQGLDVSKTLSKPRPTDLAGAEELTRGIYRNGARAVARSSRTSFGENTPRPAKK